MFLTSSQSARALIPISYPCWANLCTRITQGKHKHLFRRTSSFRNKGWNNMLKLSTTYQLLRFGKTYLPADVRQPKIDKSMGLKAEVNNVRLTQGI
jgi:hypothetical protein